jgi:uncharacterized protein YjbI with pentapeptide repeats
MSPEKSRSTGGLDGCRLHLPDFWPDVANGTQREGRSLRDCASVLVDPPDLPELARHVLAAGEAGDLVLDGVLVEQVDATPVDVRALRLTECELRGVVLRSADTPSAELRDVLIRDCDLSNLDARTGSIRRVQIRGSRLVGFGIRDPDVREFKVIDSSLALASFAFGRLRNVAFERVDLTEASFMQAHLEAVEFVDCRLAGADFRGVRVNGCAIRGTALDGVLGLESLRGASMPWSDVVASAGAFAGALGIVIESG